MQKTRFRLFLAGVGVVGLLVTAFVLSPAAPAAGKGVGQSLLAQQRGQSLEGHDGDHEAMHTACLAGDTEAMEREMDRVHPEWRSHHESMHGSAGTDMMGGGMMGSGMMGGGMMGGGMMGTQPQGMDNMSRMMGR